MLRVAVELVREVGVSGFNIDEVARRSGVAKTTIYRHFPTKNQLLVAALDGSMTVPSTPDTGSLRNDLLEFLAEVRPVFADVSVRTVFFDIYAAAARDPELRELQRSMLHARAAPTRAIFEHAQARGEISPDLDYASAVEIMEGTFILRSMLRPDSLADLDLDRLVDRIIKQLSW